MFVPVSERHGVLQTIFISTGKTALDLASLQYTLNGAAINNLRDGVTGLILFDGVRFLECLEGEDDIVDAAFKRITQNALHRTKAPSSARARSCPNASSRPGAGPAADFKPKPMARGCRSLSTTSSRNMTDLNTQALFSSFARIRP